MVKNRWTLGGITAYRESLMMHFDNTIPSGDFPVLCRLGIMSSASGITTYHNRMYHEKENDTNLCPF